MRKNFSPGWLLDCILFVVATAGTHLAQVADRPITAVLVYLVGVILIAVHSGVYAALIAAFAASFVYNFLLSEPVFEFGVTTVDEAVPLIAFNATALITGTLVGRLRDTANKASRAQSETAFLLTISDRLQRAVKVEEIETTLRQILPTQGVSSVHIYLAQGDFYVRPGSGEVIMDRLAPLMEGVAQGASEKSLILELAGARGILGLARFRLTDLIEDRPRLPDLKSISALIALAIERCILLDEVAENRAQARSETLKDTLLSSVSHDLRTPITVIEAAAGALVSPKIRLPEAERVTLLETIIEQCHRLDRYTGELLNVGQIQAGLTSTSTQVVDLRELSTLAIRQLRTLHPDITIERQYDEDPVLIDANPSLIEQAIFNLLDNARKYGLNQPVSLGVRTDGELAELTVTDQGRGIDDRDKKRMFERFFKGNHNGNHEGSGLGLYIAKGFVESCGGQIDVVSPVEEGRGTRIELRFPLCKDRSHPPEDQSR